jgi:YVTN family beta-propeller protein
MSTICRGAWMEEAMKRIRFVLVAALALLCLGRSSECEAAAYAYVANNQDPNLDICAITVADPATVKCYVFEDSLQGNLLGVAITPDGEVYVANPGADAVYVIDANGDVSTINDIGVKPTGVAASPTGGYVYVTNRGDGQDNGIVSKINTSTGEIVPIKVGIDPIGVAVSAGGDLIWVANRKSGSVSIIDALTRDVHTIENIGGKPVGVAVSPKGDYVYVTNRGDGTVSVIDTATRQEVTAREDLPRPRVGTAPVGVAVSPDGSLVYVAGLDIDEGAVFVIDTSGAPDHFEVIDRIKPVGERPVGVALTPDGGYLYVTNRGDGSSSGTVSVIRVSDRQLIDTIEDIGEKPASFGQFIGSVSVPEAPSDLTATTESDSQIDLSWSDNSFDESRFKIERKAQSEDTYREIGSVDANVTSYSDDTGLEPYTTYSYRVRAYNNHGNSDYSDEAEATTAIVLEAPTNLTATGVSHSRIRLSWTDNSFGEFGFEIERVSEEPDSETNPGTPDETDSQTSTTGTVTNTNTFNVAANVTSYSDSGLEPYTTYRYRVRAVTDDDESGWSNEVEKRTKDDCFIATAAYGSLMEPHVVTLRRFRDAYLIPHTLGRIFVRTYYQYSPPIAHFISKHETLRAAVRLGLLPLLAFSHSMLHLGPTLTFNILVFVALFAGGLHRLCQRKKRSRRTPV